MYFSSASFHLSHFSDADSILAYCPNFGAKRRPENIAPFVLTENTLIITESDGSIIHFEKVDVIRHPLVQKVLARYEDHENKYRKLF